MLCVKVFFYYKKKFYVKYFIENKTVESDKFYNQIVEIAKTYLPKMKGTWWTKKTEAEIIKLFDRIWSFGPKTARSNILINNISDYDGSFIWQSLVF